MDLKVCFYWICEIALISSNDFSTSSFLSFLAPHLLTLCLGYVTLLHIMFMFYCLLLSYRFPKLWSYFSIFFSLCFQMTYFCWSSFKFTDRFLGHLQCTLEPNQWVLHFNYIFKFWIFLFVWPSFPAEFPYLHSLSFKSMCIFTITIFCFSSHLGQFLLPAFSIDYWSHFLSLHV